MAKSLALLGAADSQLEAVSFGKERPAVQGSDEAAWAKNRRAELDGPLMARWPLSLRAGRRWHALVLLALRRARAALFDDDEARKAILDLRQQVQQMRAGQRAAGRRGRQDQRAAASSRSQCSSAACSTCNNQIESLRADIAKLRGTDEQLTRDVAEVQRRQKDIAQGVDDRIRKLEPQKVSVDGKEFIADPEEKRQYDDALAVFRNGDFDKAAAAFGDF